MKATVFGAAGFIGSHLLKHLAARGYETKAVVRGDSSWRGDDLGHVFYCIGVTADFRSRPLDVIEAHVCYPTEILRHGRFDSFLYLSSTRVYGGAGTSDERAPLTVAPAEPSDLYNLSKLAAEAACLGAAREKVRVARLSNVFGADVDSCNFLSSIIRDALRKGTVHLETSLESEKDYIWVGDVVCALEAIAVHGVEPIYNVASGSNTPHRRVCALLERATGCAVTVARGAPTIRFPTIDTTRIQNLCRFTPAPLDTKLAEIVAAFERASPALV